MTTAPDANAVVHCRRRRTDHRRTEPDRGGGAATNASPRLRNLLLAVGAAITVVAVVVVAADPFGGPQPSPSASRSPAPATPPPAPPPPDGLTFRDFGVDLAAVGAPTAGRTQSKLWFAHGAWWAGMVAPATNQMRIFRLDPDRQVWADTGTLVDERPSADADFLLTDEHLYAVSAGRRPSSSNEVRLMRFTHDADAGRFVVDANFPVSIVPSGVNATSIAQDSTGTLWIAYTIDGQVWLRHTTGQDAHWSGPLPVPAAEATVDATDVATLVAFGPGRLGLAWTNQIRRSVYFSSHDDGSPAETWSPAETIVDGVGTDDHLSVKPYPLADGSTTGVAAAVRTAIDQSGGATSLDPLVLLAMRDPSGTWATHLVGQVRDRHTRPVVMIDEAAREVYVAATAPGNGGAIYYKRADLDRIVFDTGLGTPLVRSADDLAIDDATTTKQSLTAGSGLLVLAADRLTGRYLHGLVDLGGGLPAADPADPARPSVPDPPAPGHVTTYLDDDFEPWPVNTAQGIGWALRAEDAPRSMAVVDDGRGGRALRVRTAVRAAPARACRDFAEDPGVPLVIDARVRVSALGTSDTTLLSIRGSGGEAASVRVTDRGVLARFDRATKIRSTVPVRAGRWYRINVSVDQTARTASITFKTDGNRTIIKRSGMRWRMPAVKGVDSVCIETAGASAAQRIDLAEVSVLQAARR
jgi:hypothetical protein